MVCTRNMCYSKTFFMQLVFKPINPGCKEEVDYAYGLLIKRYSMENAVIRDTPKPTYKQHKANITKKFLDYRIIFFNNIRLGIVALNKDGSLTHNYDFKSIKTNIKNISRKSFEISYSIYSQYIKLLNLKKSFVRINPKNQKALILFIKMLQAHPEHNIYVKDIQLNLVHD